MGRNFVGNSGTDKISLGDITTCRFLYTENWTMLCFFRTENTSQDDSALVCKAEGDSSTRQVLFRIDQGSAPQNLEAYAGNGSGWDGPHIGGNNVELNTWYLGALANDGSGNYTIFLLEMDGTVLDNTQAATASANASDLTAEITFGRTGTGDNSDEMNGDIAFSAAFGREFTLQDVKDYLYNPAKVVARYSSDCHYFFPLGLASPEPDLSGNGETGTLTSTPSVGANPPVAPWYGVDEPVFPAAAAAGLSIPVAMHGYRQRHQSVA